MSIGGPPRQRFGEALYAAAWLGANLGFIPLLVLLLPRRVAAIAPDGALAALSGLLLLGGVTASLAHIASGAMGDFCMLRHGTRRPVAIAGLAGLIASYVALARAEYFAVLAVGVVCFQVTLNMLYAPLGALMTDYVPDARKGRVAGWLNAGLPLSLLMVPLFTWGWPADSPMAFYAVAAAIAALAMPLLIIWPFAKVAPMPANADPAGHLHAKNIHRADLMLAWSGRLFMQMGACMMVNYLFIYLLRLRHFPYLSAMPDPTLAVGRLSFLTSGAAMMGSIAAGYGADARGFRRFPMVVAALIAGGALVVFANPSSWPVLWAAYGIFQIALIGYLAIDSALVTQLLRSHPRRGTYLGLMNLTNTLPAIILPVFTLGDTAHAAGSAALSHTILGCAAMCAAAAAVVACIRSQR